jgi:hypothetical protein
MNSAVDIATCYFPVCRVFDYPWGRDLPDRTRADSRPTQPPVRWIPDLFLVSKMELTGHHFLALGSRLFTVIPLPPICAAWRVTGRL